MTKYHQKGRKSKRKKTIKLIKYFVQNTRREPKRSPRHGSSERAKNPQDRLTVHSEPESEHESESPLSAAITARRREIPHLQYMRGGFPALLLSGGAFEDSRLQDSSRRPG